MSKGRTVTLNTGAKIPQLGFGTWQAEPGQVEAAVYEALKAGYKHIDLAKVYGNQKEIAGAFKKAFAEGVKREELFITSKLWNSQHRPEHVAGALDDCLAELGLDYLDLYLVHFPVAFDSPSKPHAELFPLTEGANQPDGDVTMLDSVSIVDTWTAMTKLPKEKTRAVGVSNHTQEHLEAIIKATGVTPAVNQIERHPKLIQPKLIEFAKSKNIHITAYSAFGNNLVGEPLLFTHPEIEKIAKEVDATPAQVILAWSQVGGHSVIPKSVTASRIKANFQEIDLSQAQIDAITAIGDNYRRYNIPYIANKPRWPVNIFGEPEEKDAPHKVIV
ncbi:aldehyde reductase-like protein [Pseudovirgaria hyperparasitica]|uniref:Aldehyde reductase-like protein n=1 Tax=Pseudovirgaria hyperparasitica TaxID=470096 RepID=A0A6A6VXQ1_9PEZI|nr:aldehyde reductase-like protein [Pseudovirgaria hyperparasitica]KAF2754464.1 aldehyde reductase-like protein [Pseudovirgaria hyperparasitica]